MTLVPPPLPRAQRWRHAFVSGRAELAICGACALSCYEFDSGERFLIADVAISCSSEEYSRVRALAWVAIGVYCFGLLALNGVLLLCVHAAIRTKRATLLSVAVAFLYREYKPEAYLWELAEVVTANQTLGVLLVTL